MVHIIIVAHSELADSFKSCVEQIFLGDIDCLQIVGVKYSDGVSNVLQRVQTLISNLESKGTYNISSTPSNGFDGVEENVMEVLILTDLFGATPHNIASKLVVKNKIEVISGLNLPMLIRAISYRNTGLFLCAKKALEGGLSGIIHINDNRESLAHETN